MTLEQKGPNRRSDTDTLNADRRIASKMNKISRRAGTSNGEILIGDLIPYGVLGNLKAMLLEGASATFREDFFASLPSKFNVKNISEELRNRAAKFGAAGKILTEK